MSDAILLGGEPQMWDYTPGSAADAGDIIIEGNQPVVMHRDYDPANANATATPQAAFHGGIYTVSKDGTSGPVFEIGDPVYWNASTGATATNTDVHFGKCMKDAGANDATVEVHHFPLIGDPTS